MDNIQLRKLLIKKRAALSQSFIEENSTLICDSIQTLFQYQQSQNIAFYYGIRGEVSLTKLWHIAYSQGKKCFFPVCHGNDMTFVQADPTSKFTQNKFGVYEPQNNRDDFIERSELDLVLAPLVAFDKLGMRLGMGKGFYDRAFAFKQEKKVDHPNLIGIAYEFQKQQQLKKNSWDVLLQAIITEANIYIP